MKTTLSRNLIRFAVWGSAVATGAAAQADVILSAEVTASHGGKTVYEVAYKGNITRISSPDGTVHLINLATSQVAILKPGSKSYTVQPLSSLEAISRIGNVTVVPGVAVNLTQPANAKTISGLTAYHVTLTAEGPTVNGNQSPIISGDGWVADMSQWQSPLISVKPLFLIADLGSIGRPLCDKYDAAKAFPVILTLGDASGHSITLTVNSFTDATVDQAKMIVPAGYRQVKVGS